MGRTQIYYWFKRLKKVKVKVKVIMNVFFLLSRCCTLLICPQRTKHHQIVLIRSSPSLLWCSTTQDTRYVGIAHQTAESRQRTSPFSIPDPTFLDETRNLSGSPGSLHPRSCSLWFLGILKHQKLDIQIYYMWKWKCDEHLPPTHIQWVATRDCLTQSDWKKSRKPMRGYYCTLPNFVSRLSVVFEIQNKSGYFLDRPRIYTVLWNVLCIFSELTFSF